MPDRRKGTTLFWEYFWKLVYGERRKAERRAPRSEHIFHGCGGSCNQGRRPCNCLLCKETHE